MNYLDIVKSVKRFLRLERQRLTTEQFYAAMDATRDQMYSDIVNCQFTRHTPFTMPIETPTVFIYPHASAFKHTEFSLGYSFHAKPKDQ